MQHAASSDGKAEFMHRWLALAALAPRARRAWPWAQWAVSVVSVLVIVQACDDAGGSGSAYRDLGHGLVLTPEGRAVNILELPEAISPEEAAFWSAQQLDLAWPAAQTPQRRLPPLD